MASRDGTPPVPDTGSNMTPVYIRVLVVEVLVLAGLLWLGRHFA
jgi:hypothetical protein